MFKHNPSPEADLERDDKGVARQFDYWHETLSKQTIDRFTLGSLRRRRVEVDTGAPTITARENKAADIVVTGSDGAVPAPAPPEKVKATEPAKEEEPKAAAVEPKPATSEPKPAEE